MRSVTDAKIVMNTEMVVLVNELMSDVRRWSGLSISDPCWIR